jgi:hypothetical protein
VTNIKFLPKVAILPIFMTSKRPMGRNGAVRFSYGCIVIMSKITDKKFEASSPNRFLDKCFLILIYYTKTAIFEKKWF